MSVRLGGTLSRRLRRRAATTTGLLGLVLVAAGCSSQLPGQSSPQVSGGGQAASSSSSPTSAASVVSNVSHGAVKVSKVVKLTVKDGTFNTVFVHAGRKRLAGALSADKTAWTSHQRLEPATHYRVRTVAVDSNGVKAATHSAFRTRTLSLSQQTYPSFAPLGGQTVGVGMPVIVHFDVPVTQKAAIERHLSVTSSSHQLGAWHWISDTEVHWRPVHYWKPGTDVTVKADINSIPAGNGVYGQLSRAATFHVGSAVVSRVNMGTDQMKTFVSGRLVRTTPITTGKPGFDTRSGVKVIMEKTRHQRMDSETIGIARNSANGYNLNDVEYAMRLTYSGEFLHAAPWSVGSQGYANVSHGCTGMSTANAAWLYGMSKIGDVVEYTGTNRPMTLDNGYGDWNESFAQWKKGSALS